MVLEPKRNLDLVTSSEELIEILIEKYPESLDSHLFLDKDELHSENSLWHFNGLDSRDLIRFLNYIDSELPPETAYELRDSRTREYTRLRLEGEIIDKPDRIRMILLNRTNPN